MHQIYSFRNKEDGKLVDLVDDGKEEDDGKFEFGFLICLFSNWW